MVSTSELGLISPVFCPQMVIILQQSSTLEDGLRFVSTVIEGTGSAEESSFTSNFSMTSQHSISERSAVYKQRIDSLFGRPSRLSPFLPGGDMVRINGKRIPPFGCRQGGVAIVGQGRVPPYFDIPNEDEDIEDEVEIEDSYSRIMDDKGSSSSSSIVTDSLNHKAIRNACASTNTTNVSSIRISCEPEVEPEDTPQPQSFIITTSPDKVGSDGHSVTVNHPRSCSSIHISAESNKSGGNMWRNGSYAECPCPGSEDSKSLGLVTTPGGMLQFSVEYLGSIPVDGTTTSLQDLQIPLRNLYMDFLTGKNVMTGQLAITSDGIRFEAPKLRLVNPFSTIAVWAAIKFVARGDNIPTDCAFMPLISDPVSFVDGFTKFLV